MHNDKCTIKLKKKNDIIYQHVYLPDYMFGNVYDATECHCETYVSYLVKSNFGRFCWWIPEEAVDTVEYGKDW